MHVQFELARHDTGEPGYFFGVMVHVLTVRCAVLHPSDELDQFCVHPVNTKFVGRLLARLHQLLVDLLADLVDHFLDAAGMNATIGNELLQRESCDFAPDRLETRHHNGIRRVVDDHIDSRCRLERTDVASLATDDATLHFVVGQSHRRH